MDFEEIPKPPEHVVRYAMGLVSGPCIAMIILPRPRAAPSLTRGSKYELTCLFAGKYANTD